MNEVVLNDICELIVDCPHSTAYDEGTGYPLVRTPNIGRGRLIYSGMHRVCEEVYNKRNARAIPQTNDLIFAREATAGNVALIQEGEKVCLGQRTVLIRPNANLVNPAFLTYHLLAPEQQYKLLSTANGATVAHVNMQTIRNLKLSLPPLATQHRIATILSRYDSLIENYQKQIKLLEEAAQRLYKEWFVDLHFPGHENTNIIDGIPEGWEMKKVGEIAIISAGGDKPDVVTEEQTTECQVPIYSNGTTKDGLYGYTNKSSNTAGSITVSARGSIGFACLRMHDYFSIVRLISIKPQNNVDLMYLFQFTKVHTFMSNGAAQQQLTVPMVKAIDVVYPAESLLEAFENVVLPLYKKVQSLQSQLRLLTEARDRLLPKLMSGELTLEARAEKEDLLATPCKRGWEEDEAK